MASQTIRSLGMVALATFSLFGEDFSLSQSGVGPITVHTALTYEGKGERLVATATNDSGQSIPYVRLCVTSSTKGCLFQMWTTGQWEPGTQLNWNVSTEKRVPNLLHEVKIEALNTTKQAGSKPPAAAVLPPVQPPLVASAVHAPAPADQKEVKVAALNPVKPAASRPPASAILPPEQPLPVAPAVRAPAPAGQEAEEVARVNTAPSGSNYAQATQPFALHDGTPVRLRLNRNLSSADAKVGESVDLEVLDDVRVGDLLVIARGATALATVTQAQPKRTMGRTGKLDVNIDSVRLVNDEKIALRAVKETQGGGHTGAMTGGMVATAIVFFPVAPLLLFMHGKDITIPKGTEITAYVNGEVTLDPVKFGARGTPSAATPQPAPQFGGVKAMTNYDVIVLKGAELSDDLIIAKVRNSPANYSLNTEDLIALKKANVSEAPVPKV